MVIKFATDTSPSPGADEEDARINLYKPFEYRKLKQDPASRMARDLYKIRSRDPEFRRKADEYRVKYERENETDLKRRAEVVKEMKDRLPDPHPSSGRKKK